MTRQETPPDPASLRRRAEAGAAARPGEDFEALSPEEMRRRLHELRVHQIELEMQNEELRRTQAELETLRASYFSLYDLAPVGYCTISEMGLILEANLTSTTLLGVAKESMFRQPFSGFVPPEDQDVYYLFRKRLFEDGVPCSCELRLLRPWTAPFWANLQATLAWTADGAPVGHVVLLDISERKAAEQKLLASEKFAQATLDALEAHLCVVDERGEILAVNRAWRAFASTNPPAPPNDCIGSNYLEICDGASGPNSQEALPFAEGIRAVLQGKLDSFSMEYPCHSPNAARWFLASVNRFPDPAAPMAVIAHQNITDRVRGELALFESESNFRNFFGALDDMVFVLDERRRIVATNPAVSRRLGYAMEELAGREILGLYLPELREEASRLLGLSLAERVDSRVLAFVDKAGRPLPAETRVFHGQWNGQNVVFGIAKDLSALKASEEKFAKAFQASPVAMALADVASGRFLEVNDAFLALHGCSREEVIGMAVSELGLFANPDQRTEFRRRLVEQGRVQNFEVELLTKSGEVRHGLLSAELMLLQSRSVGLSVMQDITERKQAEEALRKSEESYRLLFENMLEGYSHCEMLYDELGRAVDFVHLKVNRAFEALTGLRDVLGRRVTELVPGIRESNAELFEAYGRVARSGHSERLESYVAALNRWFSISVYSLARDQFVVVFDNITERKLAEAALRKSESRYRLLAENMADVIWILDPASMRFTYVSPSVQRLRGYSVEEVMEQAMDEVLAPSSLGLFRELFPRNLARFLAGDPDARTSTTNVEQPRKDGSTVWTEVITTLLKDEWGAVTVLGVSRDITERKRAETELRQLADRMSLLAYLSERFAAAARTDYQPVLELLAQEIAKMFGGICLIRLFSEDGQRLQPVAMFQVLPGTDVPLPMPMAEILSKLTPDELLGAGLTLLAPPAQWEPYQARYFLQNGLGEQRVVRVPLRNQGQLIGTLGVARPLQTPPYTEEELKFLHVVGGRTALAIQNARLLAQVRRHASELERRVAERTGDLSQANAALTKALQAKDEFLANMSHELRTPLNGILALSEMLGEQVRGPLNERQLRSVRSIEASGRHLLSLINDILDLSKLEADRVALQIETISIEEICQSSLSFIKEIASKKQLPLEYHCNNMGAKFQADPRRIKQMLVNLLSNAVKFTEKGYVRLDVETDAERQVIRFSVQDTGIGIAPESLGRLFKPFTQLDSSLTRAYEGTGLGLSLVLRLANLHGGGVSVESSGVPGQGSRFTISLPWSSSNDSSASRAPAALEQFAEEHPRAATDAPLARILLAEDNEISIEAFGDYLQDLGYLVITARNGREAIDRALETKPDLILMDIQMPVLDGLEAIRRLRATSGFEALPIVALTALAMPGDRDRCLRAGATDYLSKPLGLKDLRSLIQKLLTG